MMQNLKICFFNVPLQGHVSPTMQLVKRLCEAGYEVNYWITESFSEIVKLHGAQPIIYSTSLSDIALLIHQKTLIIEILKDFAKNMKRCLEFVDRERPDCIIADSTCIWGQIIAEAAKVPLITTHASYVVQPNGCWLPPEEAMKDPINSSDPFLVEMRNACNYLSNLCDVDNLMKGQVLLYPGDLVIVFVPTWFDKGARQAHNRFKFVGPSISDVPHRSLRHLEKSVHRDKLLYISLGTIFNDQLDFYLNCIRAFEEDSDWQVVIAAGNHCRYLTTIAPSNISIYDYVPQNIILERADVFLSHGGMNSIMEAITYGVPVLLAPIIDEQRSNSIRTVEISMGSLLDLDTCTPGSIRKAVLELDADSRIRNQVESASKLLSKVDGPATAVEEIAKFLSIIE